MKQTENNLITILRICIVVFKASFMEYVIKFLTQHGSNEATKHEARFADGGYGLLVLFGMIVLWSKLL